MNVFVTFSAYMKCEGQKKITKKTNQNFVKPKTTYTQQTETPVKLHCYLQEVEF